MENNSKLGKSLLLNILLFGFMGQVAWAVENNFFNLFLFNEIGGDSVDISNMVAASSVVAVLTTLFMGSLSDKLNKRKIFISGGYIVWGITVMAFAFISPEKTASIIGTTPEAAIPATIMIVIVMDCIMTFMGSTSNDAAFNAWITDITSVSNRAKTESILALLPVAALLIVTVAFGTLSGKFGYPACFIGLGLLVTVCGIIGLFSIKDSRTGVKSSNSFMECLTYGFRPSVIKSNKGLYLSLICMGIFSVASQIFFPYLFIYVQHYVDLSTFKLSVPVIVIAAAVVIGAVVGIIKVGALIDKMGKANFVFPAALLFVIGLVLVYFADKNVIFFALSAIIAFAGYGLLMIILNAAIRDFTPEDKAGQLQGVRMIFAVMLPMIIGPRAAAKITDVFATAQYQNEYGIMVNIPAPHIYLGAAVAAAFIIIPLVFLRKVWQNNNAKEK